MFHFTTKQKEALETLKGIVQIAILIIGIVVIVTSAVVLSIEVAGILVDKTGGACWPLSDTVSCYDYQVQECLALDRYTRDECIVLVGEDR
jgi:energy-converting hydrogenase Eha subunit C